MYIVCVLTTDMKLSQLQETKISNQIARTTRRYKYLLKSERLKDFKPRVNFFSDVRVTFRVLISGAYKDVVQDDNNQWQDSLIQQFARDFAGEHGIPYTEFQIVWPKHDRGGASWYIFSIKYIFLSVA